MKNDKIIVTVVSAAQYKDKSYTCPHVQIQMGDRGSGPPPSLKNHKNIGFLSNTGPGTLKNHKAAKPALNVGTSSARKRNAI